MTDNAAGGIGPVVDRREDLDLDEVRRYSRHLIMPEVAMEGQTRLKAAKVLCIGAGGLGSPVAMYLAAAGVGTLGIVEFDIVDETNLQRQIIHGQSDVGRSQGPVREGDDRGDQPERERHPPRDAARLDATRSRS